MALDAEHALRAILARCAQDAPCHAHFADPLADYLGVRAALARGAVSTRLPDPATGEPRQLEFGTDQLAMVLRLASYSSDYSGLLPLMLHRAHASADYTQLAAQFLLIQRSYEDVATGMHNSVVCAEDVPFYDTHAIDRAQLAATFMGASQIDGLRIVCGVWPRGPVDADFHAPLKSTVPALLLSGSDDPVTPPAYAAAGRRRLQPGAAAGAGRLCARAADRAVHGSRAGALPGRARTRPRSMSSCTNNARPLPFFVTLNGPAP